MVGFQAPWWRWEMWFFTSQTHPEIWFCRPLGSEIDGTWHPTSYIWSQGQGSRCQEVGVEVSWGTQQHRA